MDKNNPISRRPTNRARGFVFTLLLLLPIIFVGTWLALRAIGGYLIIADPLERSEAVVVLSGGGNPRLIEAGRIYKEELVDKFILTETGSKLQGYNQSYSYNETLKILDMDIPPTAIFITEEHARSTYAEAIAVRTLMEKYRFRSAIIVTDPYHTRRTRMVFRQVFSGSEITILVRPVTDHWYRSETWFLRVSGWRFTFSEYIRLLFHTIGIYQV